MSNARSPHPPVPANTPGGALPRRCVPPPGPFGASGDDLCAGFPLPLARDWRHSDLDAYAGAGLLQRDATLADVVSCARGQLAYLATPYTKLACFDDGSFDLSMSLDCAVRAARWARLLALDGITAVSPIIQAVEMVHADMIAQQLDPLDGKFWERWCQPLLAASAIVIVPPIQGWQDSEGIWVEVRVALRSNRQVALIQNDEAAL